MKKRYVYDCENGGVVTYVFGSADEIKAIAKSIERHNYACVYGLSYTYGSNYDDGDGIFGIRIYKEYGIYRNAEVLHPCACSRVLMTFI